MIAFKEYRAYTQARIAANDAAMALLVGSRIAVDTLRAIAAPNNKRLPDLYPHLDEMRYVTLNVDQSITLLRESERYLAYMAIPFIVSVHETLLVAVIRMLSDAGVWSNPDGLAPDNLDLSEKHAAIFDGCRDHLTEEAQVVLDRNLELFDFIRLLRIRLVHYGGASGERLRERWKRLSGEAKKEWTELSKHSFEARDHTQLLLGCNDLVAVLAITKHLAQTINHVLGHVLSRDQWARLVINDYRDTNPHRWPKNEQRLRRVSGHARFYYGSLELTRGELEGALAAETA